MDRVIASIVSYNPNIELLKHNLDALTPQVREVMVFDNASSNKEEVRELCEKYSKVFFYGNNENLGLPSNYNKSAKIAKERNAEWILIMDQDTIIPDNLVVNFLKYVEEKDVAIITPRIWDVNAYSSDEIVAGEKQEGFSFIQDYISSASLNRLDILIDIGGFDEKLFIDMVDTDYCINVINHGYRIIRVNECVVKHQIGISSIRRFFWKEVIISEHSPLRYYYMFRNRVYCARKYKIKISEDSKYYRAFATFFISILYQSEKAEKMKMALKGICDGINMYNKY